MHTIINPRRRTRLNTERQRLTARRPLINAMQSIAALAEKNIAAEGDLGQASRDLVSRVSRCTASSPCFSEVCPYCFGGIDRGGQHAPRAQRASASTHSRSPVRKARNKFDEWATGYETWQLAAVTINLAILLASQFDKSVLEEQRSRLKRFLRSHFPDTWMVGTIQLSNHLASNIRDGEVENGQWRIGTHPDDIVAKLHIHALMPMGALSRDELSELFRREFKGTMQVRVIDVIPERSVAGAVKYGPGGWGEYAAIRKCMFDLGNRTEDGHRLLIRNSAILNRQSQRFEYNRNLTRVPGRAGYHQFMAYLDWVDEQAFAAMPVDLREIIEEMEQEFGSHGPDDDMDLDLLIHGHGWCDRDGEGFYF